VLFVSAGVRFSGRPVAILALVASAFDLKDTARENELPTGTVLAVR